MYINMCACVCVWRGWRNSASLSAEGRVLQPRQDTRNGEGYRGISVKFHNQLWPYMNAAVRALSAAILAIVQATANNATSWIHSSYSVALRAHSPKTTSVPTVSTPGVAKMIKRRLVGWLVGWLVEIRDTEVTSRVSVRVICVYSMENAGTYICVLWSIYIYISLLRYTEVSPVIYMRVRAYMCVRVYACVCVCARVCARIHICYLCKICILSFTRVRALRTEKPSEAWIVLRGCRLELRRNHNARDGTRRPNPDHSRWPAINGVTAVAHVSIFFLCAQSATEREREREDTDGVPPCSATGTGQCASTARQCA